MLIGHAIVTLNVDWLGFFAIFDHRNIAFRDLDFRDLDLLVIDGSARPAVFVCVAARQHV